MQKIEKNSELILIDVYRFILVILVVIGHCAIGYTDYWSSYTMKRESILFSGIVHYLENIHTYGLVWISGYIYYYVRYEKGGYTSTKEVIIKKAKRLLLPWIGISVLWAIPTHLILHDKEHLIRDFLLGINPDQLWFLLMLFWCFIIVHGLSYQVHFDRLERKKTIYVVCVSYCVCIACVFVHYLGIPNMFRLISGLQYVFYFVIGVFSRRMSNNGFPQNKKKTAILYLLIHAILYIGYQKIMKQLSIPGTTALGYLVSPLCSMFGVLAFWLLLNSIPIAVTYASKKYWSIQWPVFLLHQQIIYFILKNFMNTNVHPIIVVLTAFIISFSGSIIVYMIARRVLLILKK